MRALESTASAPSTSAVEQPCKFGTVVRALWPIKPALRLSQRMGCTERHAQFLIDGERGVTLDCFLALIDEIRDRPMPD